MLTFRIRLSLTILFALLLVAVATAQYRRNRDIPNALQAYYAENLPTLIKAKATYDPTNLFQNAQSIPTK